MKKIIIFLFIFLNLSIPVVAFAGSAECDCTYFNPETREINGKDTQTITSGNCYDLAERIMEVTCPVDDEISDCLEQVECILKPVFYENIKCECEVYSSGELKATIFPTIKKSSLETAEQACQAKGYQLGIDSGGTTINICKPYIPETTKIEDEFKLQAPILQVKIPGFDKFSDPPKIMDDSGRAYFPWAGEYIRAVYNFGLVAISILAALMIIISGIKIIFSGIGGDRKEAYKRITQAIIGLVLAWGSYTLLFMINPQLVNLKNLEVKLIQPMPIYEDLAGKEDVEVKSDTGKCGGVSNRSQTLITDLGLKGDYYKYSNYSTRYGPLCETPATIKAIILHYTATPPSTKVSGIVKYWGNDQIPVKEQSGASCQIILDRDGSVYQITETLEEKVICHGGSSGKNWNIGGLGIEIMGENTKELMGNTRQMKAVAEMVKKIATRYGIPLTNKVEDLMGGTGGIFSHEQITRCQGAKAQKIDPGEEYMKEIFKLISGTYIDWKADPKCKK